MFSPTLGSAFPFYLLPSIPFRRRRSSGFTTTTSPSTSPSTSPPTLTTIPPPTYLSGHRSHLRCTRCLTDLCHTAQIISKGFTGRHGRAYLVSAPPLPSSSTTHADANPAGPANLPNTHLHKAVPRMLVTGAHTVSDVSCAMCGSVLGWKYVAAEEEGQKYKVGKFILETKRVCRGVCWENDGESEGEAGGVGGDGGGSKGEMGAGDGEDIEFDSQDEDECEDLFAGVWTKELAMKKRKGRAWREGGQVAEDV